MSCGGKHGDGNQGGEGSSQGGGHGDSAGGNGGGAGNAAPSQPSGSEGGDAKPKSMFRSLYGAALRRLNPGAARDAMKKDS